MVGMCVATKPPTKVPTRMPGVMLRKMSQCTAPRALWARALEMEVIMMLASEVPRAICWTYSGGTPCPGKIATSMGTMTMPPPTPSSPARTPATAPQQR